MASLKDLLGEYDQLGDAGFSAAHDYTSRQRRLEQWGEKARGAIAALIEARAGIDIELPAAEGTPEPPDRTGA